MNQKSNRSNAKQKAKKFLNGDFSGVVLGTSAIYFLITLLGGNIPIIGTFITLISFVLYKNIEIFNFKVHRSNIALDIKEMFNFDKTFSLILGRLWALLQTWPAIVINIVGSLFFSSSFLFALPFVIDDTIDTMLLLSAILFCISVITLSIGTIVSVILSLNYVLTEFILIENPEMNVTEAVNLSKEMMKGYKKEWFIMQLSFIPWNLLNLITFGLVSIYTTPYKIHTSIIYYDTIKTNFYTSQKEINELKENINTETKEDL